MNLVYFQVPVRRDQFHQRSTSADPKSALKLLNLNVFFALLGSACVKAAHRTLVKLTPGEREIWRKFGIKREKNKVKGKE